MSPNVAKLLIVSDIICQTSLNIAYEIIEKVSGTAMQKVSSVQKLRSFIETSGFDAFRLIFIVFRNTFNVDRINKNFAVAVTIREKKIENLFQVSTFIYQTVHESSVCTSKIEVV